MAMAERWMDQGAQFLHLVDLDGAREGIPRNKEVIQAIVERSFVPVQVGGGIRDLATVDDYLSLGVCRVILGTVAFTDPRFLQEACAKWPERVAVDIAAKEGKAAISGWIRETEVLAIDLARRCEELGASEIIYTDVLRDGTQKGLNLRAIREVARVLKIPVIASGGISTIEDIKALQPLEQEGVSGVIVGRALYAGTLKLPQAITLAEGKRR